MISKENQNIEFKESWRDECLKWICGFANAKGGILYIGVDDKGKVVGVEDSKKLMEDIPNKIVNLLGIVCDVERLTQGKREYLKITVQPYTVPIAYKGVYHYRIGNTKQELGGAALQDFLFRKMGLSWDDAAYTSANVDCIDERAVQYFLKAGIRAGRLPESCLNDAISVTLENLNLLTENGKLKNAAILLFAKNPNKYIPAVQFKIGRFGADDADLISQDLIEGNIIQMAEQVVEVLKNKYLLSFISYEGLQRIESLEIPEDALREAIFNSIIHKNYAGVAIQMKIWSDRIELWNDGEFPFGFTAEDLKNGRKSKPRNRNIANAFYKAGFVESWGRGIKKICNKFTAAGLPEPVFENYCGGVNVTIPRKNPEVKELSAAYLRAFGDQKIVNNLNNDESSQKTDETTQKTDETTQKIENTTQKVDETTQKSSQKTENTTQKAEETTQKTENTTQKIDETTQKSSQKDENTTQKILEAIKENPAVTRDELALICGISSDGIKYQLSNMKKNGLINRIGPDKGGKWEVIKND